MARTKGAGKPKQPKKKPLSGPSGPLLAADESATQYKKELIETSEPDYNKVFEEKLAQQYKEFEHMKQSTTLVKKLLRVLAIIMVLVIIALLILTYSG